MPVARCPFCRSTYLRQARGLALLILAAVTGVHRYRCAECDTRFWRPCPWRLRAGLKRGGRL